ncbi:hypothetical protein F4859DRAFT_510889 [Xylaria cf. heliscus]|nr:hypothetical protein F4859DRAFT_510889 [Xylaria cf. heliscus]
MPIIKNTRDTSVSQVIFLNFKNPCNNVIQCDSRQDAIDSLLEMIGLTPGFVSSLKLWEKKAIVFLASHAVDWRSCIKEYNDIALCFSRRPRSEKALASGLRHEDRRPLDYVQRIWRYRIEPNIVRLRERSYHLNRGISAVAPPGVVVPQTAQPPLPTAAGSTMTVATITTTVAVSNPTPPSGQDLSVSVDSNTSRAATQNGSSSTIAVAATGPNTPTPNATANIGKTNNSREGINKKDAKSLPANIPEGSNDALNDLEDQGKAASSPATDGSEENDDRNEKAGQGAEQDVSMQGDEDDDDDDETDVPLCKKRKYQA